MKSKIRLTPELETQILASIRAGGYAHMAAQAWGVPQRVWRRWQAHSTGAEPREPYRTFFLKVEQALAQARLKAEMAALAKGPRFWLKNGPGKDEAPGWATGRAGQPPAQPGDPFTSQAFLDFLASLRSILAPYPEALAALAEALGMGEKAS